MLGLFPDSARVERRGPDARRRAAPRPSPTEFGTPLVVYCEADAAGAGAVAPRGGRRAGTSRSGRRRSRTSPCCACSARRGSAPTSPRPASWRSPARPASGATSSSSTATTRTRRCSARRRPRARPSSSTRPTRRRSRPRPACGACSCASRSASTPTRTRRSAPATTARSSASRRRRRALLIEDALARGLDVLGLHVHVGSQLADFDAQAETIVRLASFAASCRDALGWTARVADLGGGFGIRHNLDEHAPDAAVLAASAVETARTRVRRGRACRRRRCGSSRAARSSARPA